jgi:sugar/nucleoside kinase (ribokinase family)
MTPDILCIGAVLWDIIGRHPHAMPLGADRPGHITRLPGGVAMNIAMALARLGLQPALLACIGNDPEGDDLIKAATALGLQTTHIHRTTHPTDRYMAIEGANGLIAAIADAHSLERAGASILKPLSDGTLGTPQNPWSGPIALDGNLTAALLSTIATAPLFAKADLRIAPASPGKALRLTPFLRHPNATLYLNLEEANLLAATTHSTAHDAAAALLILGAQHILVTDGPHPTADARAGHGVITAQPPKITPARITGAGDTFMAAHIVASLHGMDRTTALATALTIAANYVAGQDPDLSLLKAHT